MVELGKKLFYDHRLSANNSKSCASCHNPSLAYTDGYRTNTGIYGDELLHNTPSLINVSELKVLQSDHPYLFTLEEQIKRPMYNLHPIEMGVQLNQNNLINYLQEDSTYQQLFHSVFGKDSSITLLNIEKSIIAFIKSIQSYNSRYDQYVRGEIKFTTEELNGLKLFSSSKLKCATCHRPPQFSSAYYTNHIDSAFANIGLYNINNKNIYPSEDNGIVKYTNDVKHNGRFKIPSLRNVMLTAPYMHDGSVSTIDEVLDIYVQGGRLINHEYHRGDGRKNKNKHPSISGFKLSNKERNELKMFLHTLTDSVSFH
jgi:Cytochrome c peroxidase